MDKNIRLGIIGAGKMANWHMKAYKKIKGVLPVAISNPTPARGKAFAKKFGIKHYYENSFEMIIKDELDVIDICVPAVYHQEYILSALNKGLHVYVEKPMCINNKEALKIVEVNKKTNRIIFNGFNYRYWPEMKKIKSIVNSGKLGEIRFARMIRVTKDTPGIAGKHPIRGDLFWDFHSHFVDLLFFFGFAEPEEIVAMGVNVHDWPMQPDTGAVLIKFSNNALAEITTSSASPGLAPEILLIGTQGTLRLNYGKISIVPKQDEWSLSHLILMMFSEAITIPYRILRNPFIHSCQHFIQCVQEGRRSDSDEHSACKVLRVTEAAVESWGKKHS